MCVGGEGSREGNEISRIVKSLFSITWKQKTKLRTLIKNNGDIILYIRDHIFYVVLTYYYDWLLCLFACSQNSDSVLSNSPLKLLYSTLSLTTSSVPPLSLISPHPQFHSSICHLTCWLHYFRVARLSKQKIRC